MSPFRVCRGGVLRGVPPTFTAPFPQHMPAFPTRQRTCTLAFHTRTRLPLALPVCVFFYTMFLRRYLTYHMILSL